MVREPPGLGNCSINIWDGSELELAWSKKSSSKFENNFPMFLLTLISNPSVFNVRDVLHWVIFLVMKTFSNIFQSTFYWIRKYLKLNIWMLLLVLLIMRVLLSFLLKLNSYHPHTFTLALQNTVKQNHCASHNCYSVKNMLKLLAFKWILNELLLEKERSENMLIWWFVSIKFIRF